MSITFFNQWRQWIETGSWNWSEFDLITVVDGLEPARPKNYMSLDGQSYDKAKQQVSTNISQRIAEIVNLYREIKYFSLFIPTQYEHFKQLKREAPKRVVHKDIENFIERYEEDCNE